MISDQQAKLNNYKITKLKLLKRSSLVQQTMQNKTTKTELHQYQNKWEKKNTRQEDYQQRH